MFNFNHLVGIDIEEYQQKKEEQEKYKVNKYQKPGIYCIKVNGYVLYIGKSINMLNRVNTHQHYIQTRQQDRKYSILNDLIQKGYQIQFDVLYVSQRVTEIAIYNDLGKKEGIYIRRYLPCLNTQIPKVDDWNKWDYNPIARKITADDIIKSMEQKPMRGTLHKKLKVEDI